MKDFNSFCKTVLIIFACYFGGRMLIAGIFPATNEPAKLEVAVVKTTPIVKSSLAVNKKTLVKNWRCSLTSKEKSLIVVPIHRALAKVVPTNQPVSRETLVPVVRETKIVEIKKINSYVGVASWYGPGFHGKPMACGSPFDMNNPRHAAHRNFRLGTEVEVTNLDNNKKLIVTILDRGPFTKDRWGRFTREIDLSQAAARYLGYLDSGTTNVKIRALKSKNL